MLVPTKKNSMQQSTIVIGFNFICSLSVFNCETLDTEIKKAKMSRNKDLQYSIINRMIDDLNNDVISTPLPSISNLAQYYEVSRTTIRHVLDYFENTGVIDVSLSGKERTLLRSPEHTDKISILTSPQKKDVSLIEGYLQFNINNKTISPGDVINEVHLASKSGCELGMVQDYLTNLSKFDLVKKIKENKWLMMELSQDSAFKLFELREILETHALSKFMNLPRNDPRWVEAKHLLNEHRDFRKLVMRQAKEFSILDKKFHKLLLSALSNNYINDLFNAITMVYHFHYQWDDKNIKQRNAIALDEHMTILSKIITGDDVGANIELTRHLMTAKKEIISSALLPEL
ncbi:GntR family transcriptional regulator [Vibrio kanaloae]|uniref:GntR family transcriptional regulator n=1 Tax=Vibrio kanaloae TaxID=170673 RepID=UPI001EFC681B|nr:GntR family transcriptional regulator [Vibrio kanaloae]MCG9556313.1 GntR family transcriptional regulator [Vibrio kanaloae]